MNIRVKGLEELKEQSEFKSDDIKTIISIVIGLIHQIDAIADKLDQMA